MEPVKNASHLYEVERRVNHAARPGFRINEYDFVPLVERPGQAGPGST